MSEALPDHSRSNMEILDILRGRAVLWRRLFLKGDEEYLFSKRYREILDRMG